MSGVAFVEQGEGDWSAGEHGEGEGCGGGVESVAASDDEADFVVESFDAGVADAMFERVATVGVRISICHVPMSRWRHRDGNILVS